MFELIGKISTVLFCALLGVPVSLSLYHVAKRAVCLILGHDNVQNGICILIFFQDTLECKRCGHTEYSPTRDDPKRADFDRRFALAPPKKRPPSEPVNMNITIS